MLYSAKCKECATNYQTMFCCRVSYRIVLLGRGVLLLGILSHESEVVSGCPEKLLAEMLLHIEIGRWNSS